MVMIKEKFICENQGDHFILINGHKPVLYVFM
jgi:hypothetical protein